jgi:hypothetical protein
MILRAFNSLMNFHKAVKILGSVTLIAAFGVFNIGVPVAFYLCPMMNSEPSACPISDQTPVDGPAFLNQLPGCCAKVIVAERNATPFVVKAQQLQQEKMSFLAVLSTELQKPTTVTLDRYAVESPPLSNSPLFLLNSVLLI